MRSPFTSPFFKRKKKAASPSLSRRSLLSNQGDNDGYDEDGSEAPRLNGSNSREPVSVYLRIKPIPPLEQECLCIENDRNVILKPPADANTKSKSAGNKYSFSNIFRPSTSQKRIFQDTAKPIVKDVLEGKNGLIFCYGITNSGKTFTMEGSQSDPGILVRSLDLIFASIYDQQAKRFIFKPDKKNGYEIQSDFKADKDLKAWRDSKRTGDNKKQVMFHLTENCDAPSCDIPKIEMESDIACSVFVSYVEIYNEQVFDLLQEQPLDSHKRREVKKLTTDSSSHMYVKGQTEVEVKSTIEAYEVLKLGQSNRKVAATKLNYTSSRSHSIFNIRVVQAPLDEEGESVLQTSKYIRASQLSLVDLAGSERYSRTKASGDRLKEAGSINTSLMTLGNCMEILRRNQTSGIAKIVPYRNSKLTHLFKNYFEGNGKVSMIVCVNPGPEDFDETVHVLKFAAITQDVKTAKTPVAKWNTGLTPGRGYANKLLKQMKENLTEEEIDVLEKSGLGQAIFGEGGGIESYEGISIPNDGLLAERSEQIRNDLMMYEQLQEDKWEKQMKMMEETERMCRQMLADRQDMLQNMKLEDGEGREKAMNEIRTVMKEQSRELDALREMVEPLKEENEAKDREVKKLYRQMASKEKEISALSKLLAVADVKIEELNEQTEKLQNDLHDEMSLNKTLREELEYVSTGLDANSRRHKLSSRDSSAKDRKIRMLTGELESAAKEIIELEEEINHLRTENVGRRLYRTTPSRVDRKGEARLEVEIETLGREIRSLKEEVRTKDTEISALSDQVQNFKRSSLGERNATKDEEIAALEEEVASVKDQLKRQEHELSSAKRTAEQKADEAKYLKGRNRELEIALEDDSSALQSEVAANKISLKNKDHEISRLQRKYDDAESEIKRLKVQLGSQNELDEDKVRSIKDKLESALEKAETKEIENTRLRRELNRKLEENEKLEREIEALENRLLSSSASRERELSSIRSQIADKYNTDKKNWLSDMQSSLGSEMNDMKDKLSAEYRQKVRLAQKIEALKSLLEETDEDVNLSYARRNSRYGGRHSGASKSPAKSLRRVSSAHQLESSRIDYDEHNTESIHNKSLLNRSSSLPTTPVQKKRYWWQRAPASASKSTKRPTSSAAKSKGKKNKRLVEAIPDTPKTTASHPGGKVTLSHVPVENQKPGTLLQPSIGPAVQATTPSVKNFLDKGKNLKVDKYVLNHQEKRGKNIFTKLFKGNVQKSISNKGISVTFTDAELMKTTDPLEEELNHSDESFTRERKRKLQQMYPDADETETELDTSDEVNIDSIKRRCAVGINGTAKSGVKPSYYHVELDDHPHRPTPAPRTPTTVRVEYDETKRYTPSSASRRPTSAKPKWRF
eukprot:Nk52_evm21s559 gene=Nk52_evmTU21s559